MFPAPGGWYWRSSNFNRRVLKAAYLGDRMAGRRRGVAVDLAQPAARVLHHRARHLGHRGRRRVPPGRARQHPHHARHVRRCRRWGAGPGPPRHRLATAARFPRSPSGPGQRCSCVWPGPLPFDPATRRRRLPRRSRWRAPVIGDGSPYVSGRGRLQCRYGAGRPSRGQGLDAVADIRRARLRRLSAAVWFRSCAPLPDRAIHDGQPYDSKAIVGVAHGFLPGERPLTAAEFSAERTRSAPAAAAGLHDHPVDAGRGDHRRDCRPRREPESEPRLRAPRAVSANHAAVGHRPRAWRRSPGSLGGKKRSKRFASCSNVMARTASWAPA